VSQEKLESIMVNARRLFGRHGLQKTSLHEIAELARVAKATIYNHFGSKERVYLEVLSREIEEIIESISAAVADAVSPEDKLRAFAHAKFHALSEAANIQNILREKEQGQTPQASEKSTALFDREVAIIRSILEQGSQGGVFRVSDTRLTARAIGYALRGFEPIWLVEGERERIEQHLEVLVRVLSQGLAAANARKPGGKNHDSMANHTSQGRG